MIRFFLSVLVFAGIASCKTSTKPCDWQEYETKARVQSITPYVEDGDTLYSIALQFSSSSLKKEIQYLEKLQNIKIDKGTMQRNRIYEGLKYNYLVNDALSGDCKTPIISIQHQIR